MFINQPSIIWAGWQQVRAQPNPNPVRSGQRDCLRGRIFCCGNGLSGRCEFAGSQSTAGNWPVNSRGTADVHSVANRHLPSVCQVYPSVFQEFEAQSSRERLRSSRDRTAQRSPRVTRHSSAPICRMPTPHVSSEMIEDSARTASYCNAVPMGWSKRHILLRGN